MLTKTDYVSDIEVSVKMFCPQNGRTFNVIRNFVIGFIAKIVNVLLPFAIRTVIIYKLGADYAGLSSLFSSILQVLSVAELGISSAVSFSLYQPVADGNIEEIRKWLTVYKTVYRMVGLFILGMGLLIFPFIRYLVEGSYPADINLYILYLIYLSNSVVSYLAFGYKDVVLTINERRDKISLIELVISIVRSVVQIAILLATNNFYAYVIALPVFTLFYNLIINKVANIMYPEFQAWSRMSLAGIKEISSQLKGVALGKFALVSRNAFDSIAVSTFLGLTYTTIYSNYYYVISSAMSFLAVILNSMAAGIGNSLIINTKEKNYENMIKFDFYYECIVAVVTVCMFCLYQPFMRLWMGENLMYPTHTMILFCVYFYVNNLAQIRSLYSQAAGMWWEWRYLTIAEVIANLVLNFILGFFLNSDGILLSTIITTFLSSFLGISVIVLKSVFGKSSKVFFKMNFLYAVITVVCASVTSKVFSNIPTWNIGLLLVKGVCCFALGTSLLLIFYFHFECTKGYMKPLFNLVNRRVFKNVQN